MVSVTERLGEATRRFLPRATGTLPRSAQQRDPSARMFSRIRLRLTFWYSAILAVMLILAGILVYAAMYHQIIDPYVATLRGEAQQEEQVWQTQGYPPQCSQIVRGEPLQYYVACFDAHGTLISANPFASEIPPSVPTYASASDARAALADPSNPVTDTVTTMVPVFPLGQGQAGPDEHTGYRSATILRYTYVVHDSTGQQTLGVVQVGLEITAAANALSLLLRVLLAVGALTVLGSAVAGTVLARRALAPARLAFERQQQFIADASHELRTPITLMRADAEVLLRGRDRLDPDDAPLLDDIVAETEHMGALAENLLTLARLDHGGYHIEQEVVDLREVSEDVLRRARSLADERQVTLVTESMAPTLVIGDSARLGEVALILVDNAIKYNRPGGSVTLRTFRDGQHAVLEVRDTGIGIAAEDLGHLGERFYRVDKARSRQMGGAGLGLSIARSIVAEHHGTLALTSMPDQGTTATLRLPAATLPSV